MLKNRLLPFINRHEEINNLLMAPDITNDIKRMTDLSKEQSNMQPIVTKAREYIKLMDDIDENKSMLDDPELGELAKEELKELETRKPILEDEIKFLMIPKDPNDDKNIYLELRAGAGGDEAAIFVGDLFRGYLRYAENNNWKVEIMSSSESESGGYKEVVILVKGDHVYSKLKFEGGTHRVQRVPATESQGRVHTSAITVAVMPEVDDVEIEINPNDLKIDVMRSSLV
jgi:peptide chain release factor 1